MEYQNLRKLAEQFIWATSAEPGYRVLVQHVSEAGMPLVRATEQRLQEAGIDYRVQDQGDSAISDIIRGKSDRELSNYRDQEVAFLSGFDKTIRIGDVNMRANLTVSKDEYRNFLNVVGRSIADQLIYHTDWVLCRAPSQAFAEACGMDLVEFEQYYLPPMLADYSVMERAAPPLHDLMGQKNYVHILQHDPSGRGMHTDLTLHTIGGGQVKSCVGRRNLPDGEVFTAPVLDSVNGTILFGPNEEQGQRFQFIYCRFVEGVVVDAVAENEERTEALNRILDMDEGARRVGEYAKGFNPFITRLVGDGLWDEKMSGSIHLALGDCIANYADNGNRSNLHWDLIHTQTPEYGGGEVWNNGMLIRKDGRFVVRELEALNPENLEMA